jgi:hypothetical protein
MKEVEGKKKSKEKEVEGKRSRRKKKSKEKRGNLKKVIFHRVVLFCSSLRFFWIIHRQDFSATFILIWHENIPMLSFFVPVIREFHVRFSSLLTSSKWPLFERDRNDPI